MSQRIIGLDIGSTSIKVTVLETSFRTTQIVETFQRDIPAPPDDAAEGEGVNPWASTIDTLRDLKNEGRLDGDTIISSLPGDQAIHRFLQFPFSDRKQIESAVGFEFEGQVPFSLDELVFDYQVISTSDSGSKVLTVGAKLDDFEDLLNGLKSLELEPKMIGVGALVHGNTLKMMGYDQGRTLLVDMGAKRSDILVMDGENIELARTLSCGGDEITTAISELLNVSFKEAEMMKREDALVVAEGTQLFDPQESRLVPAVRVGLATLMRGVIQSVERTVGSRGEKLDRIVLCGGGAKLRGLTEYLQQVLGAPTECLDVTNSPMNKLPIGADAGVVPGKSLALAMKATSVTSGGQVNFRKGQYSYAGDFQYLRERAPAIAFLTLLLVVVGFGRIYMKHGLLTAERDAQVQALRDLSKELLGKEKEDFDSVLSLLKKRPETADVKLFPGITAKQAFYDITTIMEEVNNASKEEIVALRGSDGPAEEDVEAPVEGEKPSDVEGERKGIKAPGPGTVPPPNSLGREGRLERLRSAREKRAVGALKGPDRARLGPPKASVRPLPGTVPRPGPVKAGLENLREQRQKALEASGTASGPAQPTAPGTEVDENGEELEPKNEEVRFIVELESIQVDETGANIKGEANSLEAATLLEQKLGKHRCFQNVSLEGTDKISFERHRGWRSFRIEMDIACEEKKDDESVRGGGE